MEAVGSRSAPRLTYPGVGAGPIYHEIEPDLLRRSHVCVFLPQRRRSNTDTPQSRGSEDSSENASQQCVYQSSLRGVN